MSEAAGNIPLPAPVPSPAPAPSAPQPQGNKILLWISILALVAGLGGYFWTRYVNSPSYLAGQQLAKANKLAQDGEFAEAAQIYRTLADESPDHAAEALTNFKKMLGAPLDAAPLSQVPLVLTVAASWPGRPALGIDLADRGMELLRKKGDEEPAGALVVLNLIINGGFGRDRKHVEDLIREGDKLLEGWVKKHPDDVEVLTNFTDVLVRRGDVPGIEKLLAPHRDKLGTGDGAFRLAWAYSRQGKNEQALPLLEAFRKERLPKYLETDAEFRKLRDSFVERFRRQIAGGAAPDFDYAVHRNAADEPTRQALEQQYIGPRLWEDPKVRAAESERRKHQAVVPAMMILGELYLARARTLAEPVARKATLEKARESFLALRGTLDDNRPDVYLRAAEVAYWMGEPKEGQKHLDFLLEQTGRASEVVLGVAEVYRSVGEFALARKAIEEVYEKEKDDARKYEAAFRRARLSVDAEDEFAWLKKCDSKHEDIQVALLQTQARQAEEQGRYAEAAGHMRKALELLAKFPDSPEGSNERGVAFMWLFRLTGEKDALDKGFAALEKAVTQQPARSVVVNNAALNVYQYACLDLMMEAIDLSVLRAREGLNLLSYLYNDRPGREEQAERLRKHAGMKRARELAEKLLTLQPFQPLAYEVLAPLHAWNRDVAALKKLASQLNETGLDQSEAIKARLDFYAGTQDARIKLNRQALLDRCEKLIEEMRKKKKDRSLAVALSSLVHATLSGEAVEEKIDADRVVKLAEEASTIHPSRATSERLVEALLYRAHRRLLERDANYKKMAERTRRSLDSSHLIALALTRDGSAKALAAADADVLRVCKLLKDRSEAFPDEPSPWMYAMLKTTQPDAAAKIAAGLRDDEIHRVMRGIAPKLKPLSLPEALERYWELTLEGKQKEGESLLRNMGERGVPLPFDVKQ